MSSGRGAGLQKKQYRRQCFYGLSPSTATMPPSISCLQKLDRSAYESLSFAPSAGTPLPCISYLQRVHQFFCYKTPPPKLFLWKCGSIPAFRPPCRVECTVADDRVALVCYSFACLGNLGKQG